MLVISPNIRSGIFLDLINNPLGIHRHRQTLRGRGWGMNEPVGGRVSIFLGSEGGCFCQKGKCKFRFMPFSIIIFQRRVSYFRLRGGGSRSSLKSLRGSGPPMPTYDLGPLDLTHAHTPWGVSLPMYISC